MNFFRETQKMNMKSLFKKLRTAPTQKFPSPHGNPHNHTNWSGSSSAELSWNLNSMINLHNDLGMLLLKLSIEPVTYPTCSQVYLILSLLKIKYVPESVNSYQPRLMVFVGSLVMTMTTTISPGLDHPSYLSSMLFSELSPELRCGSLHLFFHQSLGEDSVKTVGVVTNLIIRDGQFTLPIYYCQES